MDQSSVATGASPAPVEERHPVEFTAVTGEYFRIWIVNLGLTLVTLGIYSAWAKVRKRRYLYGHTRIGGEGFEYRAKPWPILKGRLIALALLLAIVGGTNFLPLNPALKRLAEQLALIVAFMFVGPWIIVRSFRFNAYNTAYRNIRLRFEATYKDCFKITIVYGWLLLLIILYPYVKRRLLQFVAENHYYGATRFIVVDFKKPFIHAYAAGYGMFFLFAIVTGVAAAVLVAKFGKGVLDYVVLSTYVGLLPVYAYIRARTINAVWNNIRVGPVCFECVLRARDLIWIYISNLLVIILTVGLATPWAVIRLLRYRAAKTTVIAAGSLDNFVQVETQQVSAVGQEIGEMFDFDIGL